MLKVEPKPGILDIALYEAGSAPKAEERNVIKLSSNENPYGPSTKSIDAITRHASEVHLYPSTNHLDLRQAIATRFGLNDKNIICGVGSDEIISFLCYAFAGPGDEVIHTEHGFAMYKISALAAGAKPVKVRENNRYTDVDAILEACNNRTRLIFIANPNNPTSTMIDAHRIRGPFNLSTLALAAANSALTDVDYVDKSRNENTRLREWLSNSLSNLGIDSDKSCANFILARFKGSAEASACYKFLSNEGVLVRQVSNYNLPNCLRITIGDEVACKRVYESIRSFLESVR